MPAENDDRTVDPGAPEPERPAPAVVAALVANHRKFLGFLERRVGDRAVAEDILQDAFVRGIAKLDTLHSDESAVAWFYRLLRNSVIDHHRRRGSAERGLAAFGEEVERSLEPVGEVRGAICRCVGELADTLEPHYAEAIRSVELEGLPVKDYAARAGISASNAGVRVFRARAALRRRVERACGTCAEHGCLDCTCGSGCAGGSA